MIVFEGKILNQFIQFILVFPAVKTVANFSVSAQGGPPMAYAKARNWMPVAPVRPYVFIHRIFANCIADHARRRLYLGKIDVLSSPAGHLTMQQGDQDCRHVSCTGFFDLEYLDSETGKFSRAIRAGDQVGQIEDLQLTNGEVFH